MNYYEVKFTYQTELDTALVNDILAAELGEIGFESFTSDENGLIAYVPESSYDKTTGTKTGNVPTRRNHLPT